MAMAAAATQCRVYDDEKLAELMADDDGPSLAETGELIEGYDTLDTFAASQFPTTTGGRTKKSPGRASAVRRSGESVATSISSPGRAPTDTGRKLSRREEAHLVLNTRRMTKYAEERKKAEEAQKRSIAAVHAKRERKFESLMGVVADPDQLLERVDKNLELHVRAQGKKQELLYQEWKEGVYDVINDQLQSQLAQRSIAEIEARHNRNLDAFLSTQKKKGSQHYRGGVFRDTIIESDYDPMAPHQDVIKIDTRLIRDPLKRDLERMRKEKEALGLDVPDYGPCPGKSLFPVNMYAQPEATPAGHFSEPDGALKKPMQNYVETAAKKANSRVPMEHYAILEGNEHMLKEQLPGRGMVPLQGHRDGRADFREVVSHTHHLAPKGAGKADDRWLGAKGKGPVPAPCDPNRPNGLYDVVNQLADHRLHGGHGDWWMSAKGKLASIDPNPPPGTRRDLFEVINQSEGRSFPGFTSGDIWIENKGKRVFDESKLPQKISRVPGCLKDDDGRPAIY